MLLLVGEFISEAWAGNVIYHIVNKSGQTLDIYKTISHNDGDALKIPDELKSPYIPYEDYKYFKSETDAQAYYTTRADERAITTYSELEAATDVYVGYTYNGDTPEGLPVLATKMDDGATRYRIQIGNTTHYLRASTNSNNRPNYGTGGDELVALNYSFAFVSGENNDPYDMKIVSPYYPDSYLSGSSSGAYSTSDGMYFNDVAGKDDVNRFFFVNSPIGLVISAVAAPDEKGQLTYLYNNNNSYSLLHRTELGGNQNQVVQSITPLALFHIVNSNSEKALSVYAEIKYPLSVPFGLRTPLMDDSQYRYFNTLEEAAAYTKNPTEENAVTAITSTLPGSTVYIGYNYVNHPEKMDLGGNRWYYIRQNHINAPSDLSFFYSVRWTKYSDTNNDKNNNNFFIRTKDEIENISSTDSENRRRAMFRFEGNDPYNVIIRNGYDYLKDIGDNSYIKLGGSEDWRRAVYTDKTVHTPMMMLNYGDDYYTLAARHPAYPNENYIGTKKYLLFWYGHGTASGDQVHAANNDGDNRLWYYSDRQYPKLQFDRVQFETTFHIIDKEGREAISYTGMVDADMPLNYDNLPAAIRSPYLEKETLNFYKSATPNGTSADGKVKYSLSEPIERTELLKGCDVYVTYTTDHLAENPIMLSNTDIANYNLIVNGQYVHEANGTIASNAKEEVDPNYLWNLMGEDPYAVQIRNVSVSDKLLTYDTGSGNLSFDSGSNFILMGGKDGKYEIMAATGRNVNAEENPYSIGYSEAGVKLYNNYAHGTDEIQVQLNIYKPGATYHIIDKQNKKVLSAYIETETMKVPEEIVSPLVTQYHYWKKDAFILDNADNPTMFTLKDGQTEITSVAEATINKKTDIYVTYDVDETMLSTSEEIANGNRKKYRLKFLDEQNVYPYANEEIKLDLFGDEQFEADTKSSAITRTNWGWYFESDLKDPYHIKIASAAQYESWEEGERLYMYTSTVDGKTSATINTPTDYMLLGAEGAYKLAVMIDGEQHIVNSIGETSVGDGAFNITELILQPTLILLDRHGWEIMRKPLSAAIGKGDVIEPDLDAINAYNSPMVKAYKFYRNATKLKGYHKFEVSDPIMEAGLTYTATSLTGLPTSYYSMGDDIYVTYDVKEEYENTYRAAIAEGKPATQYLIQLGDFYATADNDATLSLIGMPDSEEIPNNILWYVKPNLTIDKEMGYDGGGTYDNVFDPYNLQIQNVAYSTYFTTNAIGAKVDATASMEGTYPGTDMAVTLTDGNSTVKGVGQGGTELQMTNATFMAVQDANGNMHLMPRFDHGHVISGVGNKMTLATPSTAAEQITQLQRLLMYTYIIVDNSGHEALRYKGKVGEEYPQIPSHLKSPMAKDFRFYQKFDKLDEDTKNLRSISLGADIPFYDGEYSLEDIADKEITGSFIAAGISNDTQPIYVRYAYDEEGDTHHLLSEGDWHRTAIGDNTTGNDEGDEWKFIRNATTEDPDPYNVVLYHREGNTPSDKHYAFLANGDGLSLVLARQGTFEYNFLSNLKTGETETIEGFAEKGYLNNGKQSLVKITFKDVPFESPQYYIITNEGILALIAKSEHEKASETASLPDWARSPLLNEEDYMYYANTKYDEATKKYTVDDKDRTNNLCGLPQDIVYVRYNYNKETTPLMVADTWVRKGETWNNINYSTLDITGGTWYNMEYDFLHYSGGFVPSLIQSRDGDRIHYESRDRDQNGVVDVDKKGYILDFSRDSITGYIGVQSSEKFMFKLDGGDPYAIKIYNLYKYNQDKETERLLSIYQNENESQLMYFLEKGKGYQSFMLLQKENEKKEYRHLLVATGHPNYYVKLRDNNDNPDFAFKVLSSTSTDADLQEESGDLLKESLTYNDVSAMRFYKTPSIGYYTFHGIRYNDEGTAPYSLDENGKPKVTWTAKLRRSWLTQVKMEEDLVRLFAFYEKENSTNEFVSSTETGIGRFYSNQELTEPVYDKASRTTENVYPQVDKDDTYDIYFKYTVASEELGELTSTWENVVKDVEAYHAESATKGKLRKGKVNAKWSFMVLDTDENITTGANGNTVGEQYFLYRRDDGKVGWMDNASSLHKDTEKNHNNWTCHRLAESYRQGDNDAFREGRWLWTFIGDDPYNIRLLNMESAVGVTPGAEGIYSLPKGEECYAIFTEEVDTLGNKTYPISIPMEKPQSNYGWGLCPGYGTENTISLQLPVTDDKCYPLYWKMAIGEKKDNDVLPDSVAGMVRENNRSAAIQLIRYIPVVYEDVNLTIRRDDEVAKYIDGGIELDAMVTGISKLYFAESERMYVAGDEIDTNKPEMLPLSVRRAFCTYNLFSDAFKTENGIYTVTAGPYPNYSEPQYELGADGKPIYDSPLRDEDGKIIYHYYYIDPETGEPTIHVDGPQSIYASYTVTSDIFLKTAPTEEEVKEMVNNNDHVYFMDFPELETNEKAASHAYFDTYATFRDQTGDVTKNGVTEKKKWDSASNMFVNDTEQIYNHWEFKTTTNRMTTAPENLKWYFVGDPYKVQVYSTAGAWGHNDPTDANSPIVAANLCRFDETETNFQFVVDCVHLRVPDLSNIDYRKEVDRYDEYGKPTGETVYNRGYNHPYYNNFYWEVVPAVSDVEGSFALRFKEDNDLLDYRTVYYYLAHDGLEKPYRSSVENNKMYKVNLSYNPDNEQYQDGNYRGYHKANNKNTTIKLTQPVKVYVSAKNEAGTTVTKDELSEYYGYGESITEVPRHLQRKYVKYDTPTKAQPWVLGENSNSSDDCEHTDNVFVPGTKCNRIYKFDVKYSLNDTTQHKDGSDYQHLFTSKDDFDKGTINWLDVAVNGYWFYYDKTGDDLAKLKLSNYRSVVTNDSANGWKDGLKGLHWAFIGDPYDFTILNRRQYVDETAGQYLAGTKCTIKSYQGNDSIIWTTSLQNNDQMNPAGDNDHTSEATAKADVNTHWSLQMWKTGGDDAFFLRTASLKTTVNDYNSDSKDPINQTNNYWRMVAKQYNDSDPASFFNLVPYSLSDKDSYNNDQASSNYSQTMSGLGAMQQKMEIRTVTDQDNDGAANDCFDAVISIVSEAGDVRINHKKGLEILYGKVADVLPQTLRRFGCEYNKCFYLTEGNTCSDKVDAAHKATPVSDFDFAKDDTFKDFAKKKEKVKTPVDLTYIYHVTDSVGQFFTSSEDAAMDELVWLFAYFYWMQSYSGTNVEVEITEKVFDHYVYSADGLIIDEVYREEKRTVIVTNPSESFPTSSYLDSHDQQNGVYSDESTSSDDDRLKWGFVGDPYDFTMKNYAKYLENPNAGLTIDESGNVVSSNTESTHLTIIVDENGKPYLAIVDDDGNFVDLITFDYTSTSDKSLHTVSGSGIDDSDPTGNSIKNKNVKEFWPTGLTKYANLVIYHLVMAHQNSLEHVHKGDDKLTQVPVEEKIPGGEGSDLTDDDKKNVDTRLHEFLKYWGLHNAKDSTHYFNIAGKDSNVEDKTVLVKNLLKKNGTLRDFISHPIKDDEVTRVGIGTRPLVPWYMKRQFCTYTMYQHDVQEAVTDYNSPAYEVADEEWIANGGNLYKENGEVYTDKDGNKYKADESNKRIPKTYIDEDGNPQQAYNVKWVSIFDESQWANGEKPALLAEAEALQGKPLTRLADCHKNRKVIIYLLYEVNPEQFRFSTSGRNTTAWYQMMNTVNSGDHVLDVLMNFSYSNGIGSQTDRTQHYTNDYLWAPQGDPYGFVLRSRYATINGTGWDDVVVTTKEMKEGEKATYTGSTNSDSQVKFDDKKIVHQTSADKDAETDGATNAIYEMFVGNAAFTNAFVMHPTAAQFADNDPDRESYYLVVDTKDDEANNIELTHGKLTDLKNNPNANWQMMATAEQLLPYFDRAGYVGGLDPAKAQNFSNMDIRNQLRQHVEGETQPDFALLSQAQKVVYDGAFYNNAGNIVEEGSDRPVADLLPMTFKSTNLINMAPGYYRIKAFSEEALNNDEKMNGGLTGPRYISGYRFESEKGTDVAQSDQSDQSTPLNLHFFETSMDKAEIHTFGELGTAPNGHKAMQEGSNVELLPADFDPSSIFYFDKEDTRYYTMGTQGLTVYAKPGDGTTGKTQMQQKEPEKRDADPTDDNSTLKKEFRVVDVGGTAMTIRIDETTGDNWDDVVAKNLQTNYFDFDGYNIICKKDNEMNETASGVQTTKWLLQPVGIKEDWPYNEMPLRVEVQKGGVIRNTEDEPDPYYYGTLYVPFDTRLGSTVDGAFTVTTTVLDGANLTMPSVSQFNGIGNPQYVPAEWPVVLRTSKPQEYADKHYVDMYLPYTSPQGIKYTGKLHGSYLEKELTTEYFQKEGITVADPTIMVFGVPFEDHANHAYYREKKSFGLYTNDNWWREEYPAANAPATDKERNNKYVYHNKVYYILNEPYKEHDASNGSRFIVTIFDGDDDGDKDEAPDFFGTDPSTPWPCDVFDLQGRRVAENETPETLRKNHPGLPKGVYVFGGRKVVIR